MKVCYFGIYDPNYPRNKTLMDGLREQGVEIVECNSRSRGIKKFVELYRKHRAIKNQYDVMVVGYMGHMIMPLAKLLCRKKIVFDAFLSMYDSMVNDRRVCKPRSLRARYYYFLDWISCRLADTVLLDTNTHIDYFADTFKVKRQKFERIFIGAHDKLFYPRQKPNDEKNQNFQVLWWGWMIPLHGMDYILEAADVLKNEEIDFTLMGKGAERKRVETLRNEKRLHRVTILDNVPMGELLPHIWRADVCLGIFGTTQKAGMVIPNKVYEAFAAKKAVITADTRASRELLVDGVHCLMVPTGDGLEIAKKILYLKNNPEKMQSLEEGGYGLYKEKCSQHVLGKQLLTILSAYAK